jgi:nucleoside-diphosphate-sugar epimerase
MTSSSGDLHVVFGAGPVGLAIVEELLSHDQRVRVVNRGGRPDDADPIPDGAVEGAALDVVNLEAAIDAAAGAAVVYFALNPPYHLWPELFPTLQRHTLEAAARAGAKLVVMENLYMFGPTGGAPLSEELPFSATTRKGRVRAAMHRELMAAHQRGDVRVAVGRASDFFGPRGRKSAGGEQVVRAAISRGRAQVLGDPDLPHTYTYVPDIGRGLVTLGDRDEALGRAWHLPAAETVSTRAFVQLLCDAAGSGEARLQTAPKLLLRAVGLFNRDVRELVEMVYEFEEPFVVDHSAYVEAFGDHATPLDKAVRTTVEWFRGHPEG